MDSTPHILSLGLTMKFFDAFLGLGRTNRGTPDMPLTQEQALKVMDRFDVARALVFHYFARDGDVELGNEKLGTLVKSRRLLKVWGIETAAVAEEAAGDFVRRGLAAGAKAFMVNPLVGNVRPSRSVCLKQIAGVLQKRRVPLLLVYGHPHSAEQVIDWYELADFCNGFPRLPVIAWEFRTRGNRTFFDAMAATKNLIVPVSNLWQHRMIPQVARSFGAHRLVFSAGLPGLFPGSMQAPLLYSGLPKEDIALIARGTIERLIGEADYGC
jgi:hypothetical protein